MNKGLVELNNNTAISIDEFGNTTVVSKEKTDYEFKDILEKENELELLNEDLDISSKKYEICNYNLKWSRISNIIALFAPLVIELLLIGTMNMTKFLTYYTLFGGFIKLLSISQYGLTIINKRNLKRLNLKNNTLEDKIYNLENTLRAMKEKVKYKALSDKEEKNITINNNEYSKTEIHNKVKVLKLTK